MGFIKKYRLEILASLLITLVYFSLRLIYLTRLPIFTDEAIYLRWAQIALHDSAWRFISLTDGKQPLFVWVAMVFMKFVKDPLLAGRLVSTLSGFFTMVGIWLLTFELFKNRKTAFLTTTLYAFYVFAQVYDRMALMDGMVGTFAIWAVLFSILLVRKIRLDIAYTLGFVIGAGVLTKTSGFFNIYLLPFTVLLFDFKSKFIKQRFIRWVLFAIFAVGISQIFYSVLRLSPLFQMIQTKNAIFVYPFSEWFEHPFTFFIGNLHGLFSWLFSYLTLPYILLIVFSLILINKFTKEKILLFLYFLLPLVALALFGRIIFPRFIYFMSLFLLPLAGWSLNFIINFLENKLKINKSLYFKYLANLLIITVVVAYPAFVSFQFAANPVSAAIADSDSSQYVNNWSAGWGVKESVAFFKQKAQNEKIFIATEGTFGLMPETMELYLVENPNVTIKGYWPIENMLPKETLDYARKMPAYFIFYQPRHIIIPADFPLKLLFQIKEGNSNNFYRVYQILPQK
jgi:4-amino-4-deoxy-L-arabinose transferase-like glycosyltransferase